MKTSADISCKEVMAADTQVSVSGGLLIAALLIVLLLLTACSSGKRHDYSYRSTGQADYKLNIGEKTELMASWYGRDFHGKPTASGEIYNMHDLTCAHKLYPFGTRVKVTNLSNGKDTQCIINDRGPFVAGRDLDLSYGAARQIDMVEQGVGRVQIEVLGRDLRYVRYIKYGRIDNAPALTIQAGAFRDEQNAKKLKAGLDLNYKDVYIVSALVGNDRYFRVRIGKFKDRAEAEKIAAPMAEEGYSVLIAQHGK